MKGIQDEKKKINSNGYSDSLLFSEDDLKNKDTT